MFMTIKRLYNESNNDIVTIKTVSDLHFRTEMLKYSDLPLISDLTSKG